MVSSLLNLLIIPTVFLGVIGGFFLALISPEEIRPGYKYFVFAQNLIISLVFGLLVFYYFTNLVGSLLSLVVSIILLLVLQKKNFSIVYNIMGIAVYLVVQDRLFLIAVSSLVFVLGLIFPAVLAYSFEKDEKIPDWNMFLFMLLKKYAWINLAVFLFLF